MSENCNECEQACQECNPCPENCGPIIETCPEPPYTSENCENSVNTRCITYDAGDEPCIENIENNSNFNIVLTKIFTYLKSIWTRLIPSDASISITPIDDSCDNKANIKVNISEDEGNVIEVRDDGLFATGGAFSETSITPNNLNKSVILSATGTSNHTLSGDVLKDTVTGGGNNILSVGVNGVYVPPYPGTDDVLCSDLTSVISELLDANQNNTVNSTTYDLVSFKSSIVSNCKLELISPPTGFAITGSSRVSSFGKMEWYSTLTAANNAAGSGETVLIFNDTSESLVLKNGVCYQGIGKHTISGNVTFSGSTIETSILNLKITGSLNIQASSGGNVNLSGSNFSGSVVFGKIRVYGGVFINNTSTSVTMLINNEAVVSNSFIDYFSITLATKASLINSIVDNTFPAGEVLSAVINGATSLDGSSSQVKVSNCILRSKNYKCYYIIGPQILSNVHAEVTVDTGSAIVVHCGSVSSQNRVQVDNVSAKNIGNSDSSDIYVSAIIFVSVNAVDCLPENNILVSISNCSGYSVDGAGINTVNTSINKCHGYSINNSGIQVRHSDKYSHKVFINECTGISENRFGLQAERNVHISGGTFISNYDNANGNPISIGITSEIPGVGCSLSVLRDHYYVSGVKTIAKHASAYAIKKSSSASGTVTARITGNQFLNPHVDPSTNVTPIPDFAGIDPLIVLVPGVTDSNGNIIN